MPTLVPTKRHINWTGVTMTSYDTVPVVSTFDGVTGIDFDSQGEIKTFSGDGDLYPTTKALTFQDPKATIQLADIAFIHTLPPGARGIFAATHNDAKNAALTGGGAYTVNMAHAIVENTTSGGKHREFGEGSIIISAESLDGVTSPLTYSSV